MNPVGGSARDPAPQTVAEALDRARRLGLDRLDGQLLLGHWLQQTRAWLIAHDDAVLPAVSRWPTCWASANSMA